MMCIRLYTGMAPQVWTAAPPKHICQAAFFGEMLCSESSSAHLLRCSSCEVVSIIVLISQVRRMWPERLGYLPKINGKGFKARQPGSKVCTPNHYETLPSAFSFDCQSGAQQSRYSDAHFTDQKTDAQRRSPVAELGLELSLSPSSPGSGPVLLPPAGPQGLTLSRGTGFESQRGPEACAVIEAPALLHLGRAAGLSPLLAARGRRHWRRCQVLLGGARPPLRAAHADAVFDAHPTAGRMGRGQVVESQVSQSRGECEGGHSWLVTWAAIGS